MHRSFATILTNAANVRVAALDAGGFVVVTSGRNAVFCVVGGLSGLAADPVYPLVEVPSVWLGRSLTSRWPHQNETYLERPTE